jgi:hypothetical protein
MVLLGGVVVKLHQSYTLNNSDQVHKSVTFLQGEIFPGSIRLKVQLPPQLFSEWWRRGNLRPTSE